MRHDDTKNIWHCDLADNRSMSQQLLEGGGEREVAKSKSRANYSWNS